MNEAVKLPLDLDDSLYVRRATPSDAEELAAFNIRIHSDNPGDPNLWLGEWTKDLLRGDHPTTRASDFTVVVDQTAGHKIVSSVVLIPQTWSYEEIPFAVGRPELVGTDEAYRNRGLVRLQMEIVHQWSAERGHLAEVITGIPYYYRLFGYEMALALGGGRTFPQEGLRKLKTPEIETLLVREATLDDIPQLARLYARHCTNSMITRLRDANEWRYELQGAHESSEYRRRFRLVESESGGDAVGYFEYTTWPGRIGIREMAAAPGRSLRDVSLRAARYIRDTVEDHCNDNKPVRTLFFAMGVEHAAYRSLERELVAHRPPYAWYVRVPDLPAFLQHISPVLERRLAESVVAGYSGSMQLNCTSGPIKMTWKDGGLASVQGYQPQKFSDGDAFFPGLTFLQLLFGFRDLAELHHAHPDCFVGNEEAFVVLSALFPRKHSQPVGLG